jgi:putative oxidoreductase
LAVRRLYSTFIRGVRPGAGLLLVRLAAGGTAVVHGIELLRAEAHLESMLLGGLHFILGVLLVIGLWTPAAGALFAFLALGHAYTHSELRWYYIVAGTLGAALALIGPGMWSVDARLFGWKRFEIPNRKQPIPPS